MIYDITQELRDFTYITSVYKCIAAYNLKGHQIGRKIGDMLEILTMGGVYQNPALLSRFVGLPDFESDIFVKGRVLLHVGCYIEPSDKCKCSCACFLMPM